MENALKHCGSTKTENHDWRNFNDLKIFKLSIFFLMFNLFVLVIFPILFMIIFNLFPNLNGTEDRLGAYPLFCVIIGGYGLFLTGPFFLLCCVFIFFILLSERGLKMTKYSYARVSTLDWRNFSNENIYLSFVLFYQYSIYHS